MKDNNNNNKIKKNNSLFNNDWLSSRKSLVFNYNDIIHTFLRSMEMNNY